MLLKKHVAYLALFTSIWWVFGPKIDLIAVPGYEQGIRLEDILFAGLFIFLTLSTLSKSGTVRILGGWYGVGLVAFMIASFILSMLIFNSPYTAIVFSFRWLEYLLMGAILLQVALLFRSEFIALFKFYIIINACIAPLSMLFGERYSGLSAGPWEVSSVMLLIMVSIKPLLKSSREFYIFATCVLIVIVAAQARIQLVAYIMLLALYPETRYKLLKTSFPLCIGLIISGHMYSLLEAVRFDAISLSSIKEILLTIESYGRDSNFHTITGSLPDSDASTIARLIIWSSFIYKWIDYGPVAILFGIGPGVGGVVVDGFYIRLLTEFGLVGLMIFIAFVKNILKKIDPEFRVQLIIVLGVISLTNDPITSQRIFSAICLSIGILSSCKIRRTTDSIRVRNSSVKFQGCYR